MKVHFFDKAREYLGSQNAGFFQKWDVIQMPDVLQMPILEPQKVALDLSRVPEALPLKVRKFKRVQIFRSIDQPDFVIYVEID